MIIEDHMPKSKTEIKCITHTKSDFIQGNINNISVYQELCRVYNTIFNLNFKFIDSYNNNNSNILIDSIPSLIYGDKIIRRPNVSNFLKQLVGIKGLSLPSNMQETERRIKQIEIENIEKIILSELQLVLNYFNIHDNYDNTNSLIKILKFLYQPWKMIVNTDLNIIKEISNKFGISSKYEALEYIRRINAKIENALEYLGKEYVNDTSRELNSFDLLIYSAYKTEAQILKSKMEKYSLAENFPYYLQLVQRIDMFILNGNRYEVTIQSPENIHIPKIIWNKWKFPQYPQLPPSDEENLQKFKIRRGVIGIVFFSVLIFLKLSIKGKR